MRREDLLVTIIMPIRNEVACIERSRHISFLGVRKREFLVRES
jgi:hypothetical protein